MTDDQNSKAVQSMHMDEQVLEWMEEHKQELKHSVYSQRLLYQSLVFGIIVGLAVHVGGFLIRASTPSGLLGLLADLLYALGWSLWTGAVVAIFVQVIPEVKRRQIKQALDTYETLQRDKVQTGGKRKRAVLEKQLVGRGKRQQGHKQSRHRNRKSE